MKETIVDAFNNSSEILEVVQKLAAKFMRSDTSNARNAKSVYWVLLLKKDHYLFDQNVKTKCIEYIEFHILDQLQCIFMDNRKWIVSDFDEYIFETKYMRTVLFKQHGFFVETSHNVDNLPDF